MGPAAYRLNIDNFYNFHGKTRLPVVVLGPVSVEELVSVEDTLRLLRLLREEGKYPCMLMVLGLMENRIDGISIKEKHLQLINYAF